ncbi:uncharacterized protein LOC114678261 [Macaca mulatta]
MVPQVTRLTARLGRKDCGKARVLHLKLNSRVIRCSCCLPLGPGLCCSPPSVHVKLEFSTVLCGVTDSVKGFLHLNKIGSSSAHLDHMPRKGGPAWNTGASGHGAQLFGQTLIKMTVKVFC